MPLTEILTLLAIFTGIGVLISLCLLNLLAGRTVEITLPAKDPPSISILLAVRNEAAVVRRCLDSLVAQQYPVGKLEILVGNDDSGDGTGQIIAEYEARYPFVKLLDISQNMGLAKGKSNVLAHLAGHASGEVFLLTDADMWLPPTWCQAMTESFEEGVGIVTGFTTVERDTFFGKMQAVDWALAIGKLKVLADRGIPVSSMGNNMAVLASAYKATGGYEALPFSINEDFQLTRQLTRLGYRLKQLDCAAVCGITLPAGDFRSLMQQRRRWMKGALQLPAWMVLMLIMQALYYPFAVAGMFLIPWFWVVVVLKVCLQTSFCVRTTRKAGNPLKIGVCLRYEFYAAIISLSTLIYYFLPGGIKWKGRTY